MKLPGGTEPQLRLWIWAIGAGLSLGFYFSHATSRPRYTALGTERRLFGLSDLSIRLLESPKTGQWALVGEENSPWLSVGPSRAAPSRRWAPFHVTGTWQLDGNGVRKIWSMAATGWLDDRHLWRDDGWRSVPWILDLARRRVTLGRWSQVQARHDQEQASLVLDSDRSNVELSSTLESALEQVAPELHGPRGYRLVALEGRWFLLVHPVKQKVVPAGLYAISTGLTPRVLRLTEDARPRCLSRDGRTLFFTREGALWRLDFRRSLPQLVAEIPVPNLPDPLAPDPR